MYEYIPYTYRVIFKETGKFYYGCKYAEDGYTHPELFWNIENKKGYFTSSKIIHKMIKEYGHDAFEVEIRKTFKTKKDTFIYEQKVLNKIINWDNCINAGVGGYYDSNKQRRIKINGVSSYDISRLKNIEYWNSIDETGISKAKQRGKYLINVKKSKEHIDKIKYTKEKIDDNGLNSYQRGAIKITGENNPSKKDANKQKISDGVKEYIRNLSELEKTRHHDKLKKAMQRPEVREKIKKWNQENNPARETIWYNDGVKNYRLKKNDIMINELNLKEGRLKFKIVRTEKTCPYCQKIGKGPNMKRYHFDNCKFKKEIL